MSGGGGQPRGGRETRQQRQSPQGEQRAATPGQRPEYLLPNEEIILDARPAWTNWFGALLFAVLILLGGLVNGDGGALVGSLVIAALIVGYVWYQRRKIHYYVTDKRVIVATGIASAATNEAWHVDVKGMQTGANIIERILGHGHVSLSTDIMSRGAMLPGLGGLKAMKLGGVSNYGEVASVIREQQQRAKEY